jgi:outer membrane protein W
MRKGIVVLAILFVTTAAHAQKAGTVDVSAFVSDVAITTRSLTGTSYDVAYGASANYFFSAHWSAALSVERADRWFVLRTNGIDAPVPNEGGRFRVFPVDALVRYNFVNDTRWKPYIGAGLNYERRPLGISAQTALELNGGVTFAITPHLGINIDGKLQPHEAEINSGPLFRSAVGLSWRF